MTLCVIDGGHCVCQPQDGVFCPNAKTDADRCKVAKAYRSIPWDDGEAMSEQVDVVGAVVPLTWLYTHCRAVGMTCVSDSGKWEHDIALFIVNLQAEITALRERVAELSRLMAAADAMRQQYEMCAGLQGVPLVRLPSATAYDAIRREMGKA
jgi:hypothetical protein